MECHELPKSGHSQATNCRSDAVRWSKEEPRVACVERGSGRARRNPFVWTFANRGSWRLCPPDVAGKACCMGSLYERAERLPLVVGSDRITLTAVHSRRSAVGRRLLLLHGNPRNLDDFAALVPKLDFAAEVLAIDLPGFGRSAPAPATLSALTLTDLASVAFAAADAHGWSTFEVIGHSHGGGVAQAMAWGANARVKRITACTSYASRRGDSRHSCSFPTRVTCCRSRSRSSSPSTRVETTPTTSDSLCPPPSANQQEGGEAERRGGLFVRAAICSNDAAGCVELTRSTQRRRRRWRR